MIISHTQLDGERGCLKLKVIVDEPSVEETVRILMDDNYDPTEAPRATALTSMVIKPSAPL